MTALHPLGRAWARLPGLLRTVVISVTLAAGYYAAARLGLRYASIGRSISLVWPPTGIALAALTALGLRYWPSVALAALARQPRDSGSAADRRAHRRRQHARGGARGRALLRRAGGAAPGSMPTRIVRTLVLVAAPLGAVVSAGFGVTALQLAGALPALGRHAAFGGLVDRRPARRAGGRPLLLAWLLPRSTGAHARHARGRARSASAR